MSLEAVCSFGEEACLVCGEGDNTDGAFGERLILMCSSCGFRCVHVGCEEKRTQARISEASALDPENLWFCSPECERVERQFEPLIRNTVLPTTGRSIEVVGTSGRKRGDSMQADAALRILRGSFEPLIMENDRCLIEMVVNSFVTPDGEETGEDGGHDYNVPLVLNHNCAMQAELDLEAKEQLSAGGFRTLILREGNTIICAATVRIFGTLFAEIPFVGTREDFRKQGALRMLFAAIETVLTELKVTQIFIPSIRSLKRMWCQNFFFERMTLDEVAKVEDHIVFPDQDSCILLRKRLGQAIAPLRVGPSAAVSAKNKEEEGKRPRRAAAKARKAMAPDDAGDSSDSSEASDASADVHMSTSDEEGSEDGDAEEVEAEPKGRETVPKPTEQGKHTVREAGLPQSSEIMKMSALRAVVNGGILSLGLQSVQKMRSSRHCCRHQRRNAPKKLSNDDKLKLLMSQVARSEATATNISREQAQARGLQEG